MKGGRIAEQKGAGDLQGAMRLCKRFDPITASSAPCCAVCSKRNICSGIVAGKARETVFQTMQVSC